jgi:flavin-dependent dehydrogenase
MSIPQHCDVTVIGGGPGGSMTAAYLARDGYDVVLLEKQTHPRLVVGESLIPDFWKYCDEAKVTDKIVAEGFIRKAGGTVDWLGQTRRLAFKDFGYTRPALHVERDCFDNLLLQHARACGARVFEEAAVQSVDLDGGERPSCLYRTANGAGAIRSRYVVDASGQTAILGRQLGLRVMDEDFKFMSVWGYFADSRYYAPDGNDYPASEARGPNPPTTFVASVPGTGDWGWMWHIMLRQSTSVGFVLPMDTLRLVKDGGGGWESFFLQKCESLPRLHKLLAGARLLPDSVRVIRDYSYRSTQVAGPGFFLVGDAAGFIDPIFSIGVVLGMYSARAASWAIDRDFKAPQRSEQHRAIFTGQVQDRMEMARTLALPQYDLAAPASKQAKAVMQFSDSHARALMLAASSLTARSQHFHALLVDDTPAAVAGG